MRKFIGLSWFGIISAKTIFIVFWYSLYKFGWGKIGQPIDIKNNLIQFWSNTTVYIALVSALGLIIDVSGCFLEHESIMVPLNKWYVEVTEGL